MIERPERIKALLNAPVRKTIEDITPKVPLGEIARTAVTSSSLVAVGHDPATDTLSVEFPGGVVWHYADVTAEEYALLRNAKSIGTHFHAHIRKHKDGSKQSR